MVFRFRIIIQQTSLFVCFCYVFRLNVNISQFIRFATVSSHVVDFNARNKSLTAKLLKQGYCAGPTMFCQ